MHVCPYACFVIYMYVGFKSSSELMLYVLYSDFKQNLYLCICILLKFGKSLVAKEEERAEYSSLWDSGVNCCLF